MAKGVAESTDITEKVIIAKSKEDLFVRQVMEEFREEPPEWYADSIVIDEQFKSMFELPAELKNGPKQTSQAKEYRYCWVEIDDENITRSYAKDLWIPVNKDNHPFLPRRYFNYEGGIMRSGNTKHLLFYQRKSYNEARKKAAARRATTRLEDSKRALENLEGPVRMEEVSGSGGYGVTPADPPIQTDWQGNRVEDQPIEID